MSVCFFSIFAISSFVISLNTSTSFNCNVIPALNGFKLNSPNSDTPRYNTFLLIELKTFVYHHSMTSLLLKLA
ncbi:hypothetical protein Hanom_Chr09g00823551 [Helianthus anomalus]